MKLLEVAAAWRRPFMPLLRMLARRRIFVPIIAAYAARHIRRYGDSTAGTAKAPGAIRILALNSTRWQADLIILAADPRVEVLILPEEVQAMVAAPFLSALRRPLAGGAWWEEKYRPAVSVALAALDRYLQLFLPELRRGVRFDVMATCTFYYFQDRAWESAAPKAGIPFFCLHKENQKDDAIVAQTVERYRARCYRFKGSVLAVYNRKERQCLLDGGVADESRVAVVGAIRMDDLFRRLADDGLPPPGDAVTLFSFRHNIGGLLLGPADEGGGFSCSDAVGCIEYFDLVHAAIARLALDNPHVPVFIKPKWLPVWGEKIRDAIRRLVGVEPDSIPNLAITTDLDAQALIRRSMVVVGVNSTALIEARILGRPVVIPLFAELTGRHAGHVYFRKFLGKDFLVANSPRELAETVKVLLGGQHGPMQPPKDLVEEFLGFDDGLSRERVVRLFQGAVAAGGLRLAGSAGKQAGLEI
ncbi:MAG: hypothetical protein AB1413_02950 [Thermodesulfobacteriota bacterium]